MTSPETLIDLGELPPSAQPAAGNAGWPPWQRLRRRLGRSPLAPALIVAMTMLTMVIATSAAPSPGAALVPVFTVEGQAAFTDHRHLYAITSLGRTGALTITAYRLNDGAQIWTARLDGHAGSTIVMPADGMLLVSSGVGAEEPPGEHLSRLDPATGRTLWSTAGSFQVALSDLVLLRRSSQVNGPPARFARESELLAVAASTGRVIWQRDAVSRSTVVDPAGRVVTIEGHGRLSSYDLRTGQRLATGTFGGTAARAGDDPNGGAELLLHAPSSTAVVRRGDEHTTWLSGYDTATLERRFERTFHGTAGRSESWPQPCGPVLCLGGNRPPVAVDPLTGEPVWAARWLGSVEVGVHDAAAAPHWLSDYLLLTAWRRVDYRDVSHNWLVNGATGEPVLALGNWELQIDHRTDPDEPVLALLAPEGPGLGPTWIGRLRPDITGIDPLGVVEPGDGQCQLSRGPYLICGDGVLSTSRRTEVTVWRVG